MPDGIHFIDLGPSVDDFVENFYQKKFGSLKNWATFAPASEKGAGFYTKIIDKVERLVQASTENKIIESVDFLRMNVAGSS